MKWCSGCKQDKEEDMFGRNKSTKDGLQRWCRECSTNYGRRFRKEQPDRVFINQTMYKRRKGNSLARSIQNRIRSNLYRLTIGQIKEECDSICGCKWEELIYYIESQFEEGMTWDNHTSGGWHIDHIRPVSSFNLRKGEDRKKVNHYTNLRPMWAEDNLRKGARIE